MPDDLTDTIRENASGPKSARGDSISLEQHSLTEQIEADRYLSSKQATKAKNLGLRIVKIVPPGV